MQTETQPILAQLEGRWDPANVQDAAARALPVAEAYFETAEGQIYKSASSAWAEGALRIATGQAATQPEIERTRSTYFASVGDRPATVAFKRQMREMYGRAILGALGDPNIQGTLKLPDEFARDVINKQNGAQGTGQPGQRIPRRSPGGYEYEIER